MTVRGGVELGVKIGCPPPLALLPIVVPRARAPVRWVRDDLDVPPSHREEEKMRKATPRAAPLFFRRRLQRQSGQGFLPPLRRLRKLADAF